ncbi:MAG: hypothetical protein HY901_19535 [Deltaproteobacteria bacterium]|nr:hypothetical protein [Deltaproteobacteria bacterium]
MRRRGAAVVGIDLAPSADASGVDIVRADFANGLPPASYDVVLATGVFEAGSCRTGAPQGNSLCGGQLLSRLRSVTARGGIVVLENFGLPLPFSLPIARAAGFELVPQAIPAVNLALGGRGCTLRRVR